MKTKLQVSKNVTMNKPDEKRLGMKVRTVVTGHDAKGRAVFVRDEQVDGTPIPGIGELAFLWNADEPAAISFRPAREVAIAMTRGDRCSYRVDAALARPILVMQKTVG